jgi:hypothetical protein
MAASVQIIRSIRSLVDEISWAFEGRCRSGPLFESYVTAITPFRVDRGFLAQRPGTRVRSAAIILLSYEPRFLAPCRHRDRKARPQLTLVLPGAGVSDGLRGTSD